MVLFSFHIFFPMIKIAENYLDFLRFHSLFFVQINYYQERMSSPIFFKYNRVKDLARCWLGTILKIHGDAPETRIRMTNDELTSE